MLLFPNTFILICFIVTSATSRKVFVINEHWVCDVKTSCSECLELPHCSWCQTENKCFSKKMPKYVNDFCQNSTINYEDYGLSFKENAECACADGEVERHCYQPGVTEGTECSGRGTCVCGHCVCDLTPDAEQPTKIITGEFCEYDNFSCDGPMCNEGPYLFKTTNGF